MCTVTFLPLAKQVFLTSNRDESKERSTAIYPEVYQLSSGRILFPKDADAGGTWIALHENGNAIVFLNGAITKHEHLPPYRKSRGLILLELIDSELPFETFQKLDLDNIEPFTAIVWENRRLFECRWDGVEKHVACPDPSRPHIWSSVTLYNPEIIAKREGWFKEWLQKIPFPTQEDIIRFHQFTGDGDSRNDLRMNRNGETFTVSITSLKLENLRSVIQYLDLKNDRKSVAEFTMEKHIPVLK